MRRRDFLRRSAIATLSTGCILDSASPTSRAVAADPESPRTAGPLVVHARNPRYFEDDAGRLVYLTGSHLGWELQDDAWGKKIAFDFAAYLELLARHRHNLIRLWCVEHTRTAEGDPDVLADPMPFERTGPGIALDGRPKFDLTRFHKPYFKRVRERTMTAGRRGIYVMVMLFQGWSLRPGDGGDPWFGHLFNPANNVQGIDGAATRPSASGAHTLANAEVTKIQEAYVRKLLATVGGQDNVLWEIANESLGTREWHEHFVRLIHREQPAHGKRQPVVLSNCRQGITNGDLQASDAEAVGPTRTAKDAYFADPPESDGGKVVLTDSDHCRPDTKDPGFVWRNFLRGNHVLVLDWGLTQPADASWEPIRRAMGLARDTAERVDLAAMVPDSNRASSGYCLAASGSEYLVYVPEGDTATIDLSDAAGRFAVEWLHGTSGRRVDGETVDGGGRRTLSVPLAAQAIGHLKRVAN